MNIDAQDTIPAELMPFHERLGKLEVSMAENTRITNEVKTSVSDLVDVLAALKGAFKVLETLGKVAKPIGYVAASVAAVWGAFIAVKSGHDITPKP